MQGRYFNRSMMKKFFLSFAVSIMTLVCFAQDEETEEKKKGFQRDKVFVGGNFGLGFGTYTVINVSPQIGYRFTDLFAAGAGVNFQYLSIKQDMGAGPYRTSQGVVGLNVFGRAYPIKQFMLQLQPEANYIFGKLKYLDTNEEYKTNTEIIPSLLAGGGLVIPSGRGAMILSVFYDLLQRPNAPYGNRPFLNFTFNVGL